MIRMRMAKGAGVDLEIAEAGEPGRPAILLLHGFPEFHAAWQEVMFRLADRFHVVAPDQRGYRGSGKPPGDENYAIGRLVADVDVLAASLWPGRRFVLAGHDWGASVAYGYAFRYPERLNGLVVVNGVHPVCFQRAIVDDPEQRRASQYIRALRAPGAAARMAEGDFRRAFSMLEAFSRSAWMTPDRREAYRDAWSRDGAMDAMLAWYRASNIAVPAVGDEDCRPALLGVDAAAVTVHVPHLVIWGEADEALRPSCLDGLGDYAGDLTIEPVAGCGHWILHEKPDLVAQRLAAFAERVG